MRRVRLELGATPPHLTQIVAGFALLHAMGEVQVSVGRSPTLAGRDDAVVRAEVDGGARLVFELRDGTDTSDADLAWCTTYFKRGYRSGVHGADERIRPLGLNYVVSAGSDWRVRQAMWAFTGMRPRRLRSLRSSAIQTLTVARPQPRVEDFEASPPRSDRPTALLMTRVWDPRRVTGEKAAAWETMNEVRVGCIRALSAELGDRFVGGLVPSPWSLERYPDLVLGRREVERRRYLQRVRTTDVCVTTRGLRDSNGWRLAEYLAASRATVTEPLVHEVPGDLGDGHGLVTFSTTEACVEAVVALMADPEHRQAVAETGHAYYRDFVRPDALVRRALAAAS